MKIVIVGAGAAGLMAAYKLSQKGHEVTILEAQNHLGGRIYTVHSPEFNSHLETGAEFIHGKLPTTFELLKEAGIKYSKDKGAFWNANDGRLRRGFEGTTDWHELEKALKKVETDMSLDDFFDEFLNTDKQLGLKVFVKNYVQGYDAADTSRMSTFAFRDELLNTDETHQYRIDGGYQKLIEYLEEKCRQGGCKIIKLSIVKEIKWAKGQIIAVTTENISYPGEKIIITVSAGVLKAENGIGSLQFIPPIPQKMKEIRTIGYGNAMKIFLQFKNDFWKQGTYIEKYGKTIKKLGFIISSSTIPVWWTQYPNDCSILTGWLGGPNTQKFESSTDETILDGAMKSVAHIFGIAREEIQANLKAWKISDWAKNPFAQGAYSYPTVDSKRIGSAITVPIEDTIYFSGEAFYSGSSIGTVEAALASGMETARIITNGMER